MVFFIEFPSFRQQSVFAPYNAPQVSDMTLYIFSHSYQIIPENSIRFLLPPFPCPILQNRREGKNNPLPAPYVAEHRKKKKAHISFQGLLRS
jgi:hypothetical protein